MNPNTVLVCGAVLIPLVVLIGNGGRYGQIAEFEALKQSLESASKDELDLKQLSCKLFDGGNV